MDLTPEQRLEAEQIYQTLRQTTDADLRRLAELLASKADAELLGRAEFQVRDAVHALGAKALQTALAGRKNRGT